MGESGETAKEDRNSGRKGKMEFFLRLIPLLLRDCKMDLNETLGLYRVGPELMQGHRFNFRSEAQTGKVRIPEKYYMGL